MGNRHPGGNKASPSTYTSHPGRLPSKGILYQLRAPCTEAYSPGILISENTIPSSSYSLAVANSHINSHSHDVLIQIIRHFPFQSHRVPSSLPSKPQQSEWTRRKVSYGGKSHQEASPSGTTESPARKLSTKTHKDTNETHLSSSTSLPSVCNTNPVKSNSRKLGPKDALRQLCQVSINTMAITALPLDRWLKERLKSWVQLSGHEGTIVPASDHTIWKKQPTASQTEAQAYLEIVKDAALEGITPKFYREIKYNNESFIEIQDLLCQFPTTSKRALMDIKIGKRTFLECEATNHARRADLYKKMVDIDPAEPTEEEHAHRAITKLRYMQYREQESSTATLGFRIEAVQLPGSPLQRNFKSVKTREQVAAVIMQFFGEDHRRIRQQLCDRLRVIRAGIENSEFFRNHEVVGSSLLVVYDETRTNAWLIDFAKSISLPSGIAPLDHRSPWVLGNHEDGVLIGIDNLVELLDVQNELMQYNRHPNINHGDKHE